MTQLLLTNSLNTFVQALTDKGKSTNTIVAYKGDINQLISFLSSKNITDASQVSTAAIDAFKQDELIGIVSPITNFVGEGPQVDKNAVGIDKSRIDEYAELIKDRGIIYESHRLVFFCVELRREVIDQLGLMLSIIHISEPTRLMSI